MSNYKLSRRHFITAAGAVFTLPLLESLFPFAKYARAAADPRRFVMVYFPNGTYNRPDKPIWRVPEGALSAGNTSLALSPFANFYPDLISINALRFDNYLPHLRAIVNDGHAGAASAYMTGVDASAIPTMTSFDNIIADESGKAAFILSGGNTGQAAPVQTNYITYRNGKGNPGISNPGDLYRQLLGKIIPQTPPAILSNDKSILDSALADFNSFMGTLGKTDKAKMDEYLSAVRNLEMKVLSSEAPVGNQTAGCATPTLDPKLDGDNAGARINPNYDPNLYLPKFYAFNEMIKIAFACDITRSVCILVDAEGSPRTFATPPASLIYQGQNITANESHIGISHTSNIAGFGYNSAVTRDRTLLSIVFDLVNRLKAANDPSGSRLLDNTIIQAGFGIEDGAHLYQGNIRPTIIAGGRNMLSSLGQSINLGNYTVKDLQYTISQKLGLTGLTNFAGSSARIAL